MAVVYYQMIKDADGVRRPVKIRQVIYHAAIEAGAEDFVYKSNEETFNRIFKK